MAEYGYDGMHDDCIDCEGAEPAPRNCPSSPKPCGHHCNHSWSHDVCCYCGIEWGEGGEIVE